MNNYQKHFKSQVMILVVVLMTTIFALAISSQMSFLLSLRQSRLIMDSVKAFYAADSGVEWKMYEFFTVKSISAPSLTNNTSCCGSSNIAIIEPSRIGSKFRIKSTGISPATGDPKINRTINTDLL
jgi:Tfp pilus assembly protein PilX